jgi:NADPH:quinone reductase-like Zn-dependent oxidoreductase
VGGGGAVGLAAIQLAAAARCHVTTTCGGQSIDRVLEAGAEQAVDYTAEVMIYYFHPIPPAN